MRKCNHCGLEVVDVTDRCPLCHSILEETEEGITPQENTYPDISHKNKKIHFILRLFLFLAIVATGASVVINYSQKTDIWWCVIVGAASFYGWWMLYIISKDDAGYRARIFTGIIGAVILIVLIDAVLGFHGWSVDYVFPGAIILVDLGLILLMLINRRNWQSYMILQIAMILMGIVPLILMYTGIVTRLLVSEISFGVSIVLFLGSVILGGRTARNEMKRRFHI